MRGLNTAAAAAERIPDDPRRRFLCWIVLDEVEPGNWTCGEADVSERLIPVFALIHAPAGVLDDAARAVYVELVERALRDALPPDDSRKLVTSVILNEVADGFWGAGGQIWRLPTFAKRAGFEHLQHLIEPAAS